MNIFTIHLKTTLPDYLSYMVVLSMNKDLSPIVAYITQLVLKV